MSKQTVEIKVLERKLTISCPSGQESALVHSANELNLRLEKINKSPAITTPDQALLMTALNLADDLLKMHQQIEKERQETKSKIELLQSTIEQALSHPSHNSSNKQA
jgi:cell division protein ZapA